MLSLPDGTKSGVQHLEGGVAGVRCRAAGVRLGGSPQRRQRPRQRRPLLLRRRLQMRDHQLQNNARYVMPCGLQIANIHIAGCTASRMCVQALGPGGTVCRETRLWVLTVHTTGVVLSAVQPAWLRERASPGRVFGLICPHSQASAGSEQSRKQGGWHCPVSCRYNH